MVLTCPCPLPVFKTRGSTRDPQLDLVIYCLLHLNLERPLIYIVTLQPRHKTVIVVGIIVLLILWAIVRRCCCSPRRQRGAGGAKASRASRGPNMAYAAGSAYNPVATPQSSTTGSHAPKGFASPPGPPPPARESYRPSRTSAWVDPAAFNGPAYPPQR